MPTTDELLTGWLTLEAGPSPAPGRFNSQACPLAGSGLLRVGLLNPGPDCAPLRMLLLRLPHKLVTKLRSDHRHQGLRIEPLATTTGPAGEAYVALILDLPSLRDIFGVLAADVAQAAEGQADGPARLHAFQRRLERWETLLQAFQPSGLSLPARQGLFGELFVLRQLMNDGIRPAAALAAWAGPQAAVHDFILPGQNAAEVKTLGTGTTTARISNAAQLDNLAHGRLWLVLVQLATPGPTAETLPALVATMTARMTASPHDATLFALRLQQAGYFDVQAPLYSEAWAVGRVQVLAVRDDFPRLRASQMLPALSNITYSLDTSGLSKFEEPFANLTATF